MRLPKGKRITDGDLAEIATFGDFVKDVHSGMTEQAAYALHYGETIFDASATKTTRLPECIAAEKAAVSLSGRINESNAAWSTGKCRRSHGHS